MIGDSTIIQRISQQAKTPFEVVQTPTVAKFEVSSKCTLNCSFCGHAHRKNIGKNVTPNEFQQFLTYIQSIPTLREVGLFYIGESALNPNLPQFFKEIKSRGYFTFLTTNGTILDTIIESIPYIDSLKVSWNYVNELDFSNKTNGSSELYDRIIHNIEEIYHECHLHHKHLTISTIDDGNKSNYNTALSELKFDSHYWLPKYSFNRNIIDHNQSTDILCYSLPCRSLFTTAYVDVELNVRLCSFSIDDSHILYNLNDYPMWTLTDKLKSIREQHLQQKIPIECRRCLQDF